MEYHPSAWLNTLVEAVADCMEAHNPMGAMGWRYQEEDESVELIVYATPVALVGGAHDGTIVVPGFSLDVQRMAKKLMQRHAHSISGGPRVVHDTELGL